MSKRILYVIIFLLASVLVWQQWFTAEQQLTPTHTVDVSESVATTSDADEMAATTTADTDDKETARPSVTVTGTYVGLRDEIGGEFNETSSYLLLDDGTEIISISLAPLVGTQKTGVESELDISRGDRVTLVGTMVEDEFVLSSVDTVE